MNRYIQKGSKVAIEGRLRYSSWEAKDGSRRSKLEVVIDEIEFMSGQGTQQGQAEHEPEDIYDEDVPF